MFPIARKARPFLRVGMFVCMVSLKHTLKKKGPGYATIHFQDRNSAASLRHKNRSEISVLCVNENPIQYIFGAGTRATRYSVDMASDSIT